ncbi:nuclear transport factor 2 family protein [Nocardioides jensenii]|uniref:nuclear transport factor 2 family protein n=1 Tax=Nocardioides jensenii TaxID=1843 RepID=UPI00082B4318|nr:nuclear transport factor 2 family protein [Nocardioides jensenii]
MATATEESARRFIATLEARDWDAWTSLMTTDVVYDMPQTGERLHGRDAYLEFNRTYPGEWHLDPRRVIADGDHAVVWFAWTLRGEDGEDGSGDAQAFFDFDGQGLITHVTDFWPEPYDPPTRPAGLAFVSMDD